MVYFYQLCDLHPTYPVAFHLYGGNHAPAGTARSVASPAATTTTTTTTASVCAARRCPAGVRLLVVHERRLPSVRPVGLVLLDHLLEQFLLFPGPRCCSRLLIRDRGGPIPYQVRPDNESCAALASPPWRGQRGCRAQRERSEGRGGVELWHAWPRSRMLVTESGLHTIVNLVALKSPPIREATCRKVGGDANLDDLGGLINSQRWGCRLAGP